MAKLLFPAEGSATREYPVKPGVNKIGRGPGNDIQILVASVSTTHCEVSFDPVVKALSVRDLGSTNGTFVDNQRVLDSTDVSNGQWIRLGDVKLQCQTEAELPAPKQRIRINASTTASIPRPPMPVAPPPPPPLPPSLSDETVRLSALSVHTQTQESKPEMPAATNQRTCINHSENLAVMICKKCVTPFCDSCVKSQTVANQKLAFCPVCGEECLPLDSLDSFRNAPEQSFFDRLPGTFSFPFKGDGFTILLSGSMFLIGVGFLQGFMSIAAIALSVFVAGYFSAYMQTIIQGAAMGDEKPPHYPDFASFRNDILQPLLLWLGCCLVCFGPALAFRIYCHFYGAVENGPLIGWALLGAGALYLPMALLAVGLHESLAAINPLLVITSILRVPVEYAVCCIVLGAVFALIEAAQLLNFIPIAGQFLSGILGLYVLMVESRILGLLFRTKRKQLGWQMA